MSASLRVTRGRIARHLALSFCLILTAGLATAGAEIDSRPVRGMALEAPAVDVAATADGQRTYVLLSDGQVSVYDVRGVTLGTLQVSKEARAISVSSDGSLLYVAAGKELQTIAVDLVQQLDITGSPFRGPADAPVTVAVFNDFQ